jgi:hypothetical protein
MAVIDEIAAERDRQLAKGWTPNHDDQHTAGEIIDAPDWGAVARLDVATSIATPHERRRLLVQAAALIVAEIERLDRAADAAGSAS